MDEILELRDYLKQIDEKRSILDQEERVVRHNLLEKLVKYYPFVWMIRSKETSFETHTYALCKRHMAVFSSEDIARSSVTNYVLKRQRESGVYASPYFHYYEILKIEPFLDGQLFDIDLPIDSMILFPLRMLQEKYSEN